MDREKAEFNEAKLEFKRDREEFKRTKLEFRENSTIQSDKGGVQDEAQRGKIGVQEREGCLQN